MSKALGLGGMLLGLGGMVLGALGLVGWLILLAAGESMPIGLVNFAAGLALNSRLLGILGIGLGIVGMVLGIIGKNKDVEPGLAKAGVGLGVTGLILGIVALLMPFILLSLIGGMIPF